MHRPRPRRFGTTLLVVALTTLSAGALPACSPTSPDFRDPRSTTPKSLGELVYQIILANLQQSDTCPETYVAQLEAHHEDFVTTFDYLVDGEVLK